jgi:hypothetical protein
MQSITLAHLIGVEYASHATMPSNNIKKRYHGLFQIIDMNQSGFKAENEYNP